MSTHFIIYLDGVFSLHDLMQVSFTAFCFSLWFMWICGSCALTKLLFFFLNIYQLIYIDISHDSSPEWSQVFLLCAAHPGWLSGLSHAPRIPWLLDRFRWLMATAEPAGSSGLVLPIMLPVVLAFI